MRLPLAGSFCRCSISSLRWISISSRRMACSCVAPSMDKMSQGIAVRFRDAILLSMRTEIFHAELSFSNEMIGIDYERIAAFEPERSYRTARNIKCERGGVRNIQTFDFSRQIESRQKIAGLPRELAKPFAFGAHHERERRFQFRIGKVGFAFFGKANEQKSARL